MKNVLIGIIMTLIVIAVGAGAFYLGQKTLKNPQTQTPLQQTTNKITSVLTPTPTQTQAKTYEAGGILIFKAYSLSAPQDWVITKEKNSYMDNMTLTKLGYKLIISQTAGGGGGCKYPGDTPAEMAQSFTSFTEITNPNGFVFRRGANGTPGGFTVCQKNTTDGSFGFPTNFGNITITSPVPSSDTIMAEIDAILASLKKQ